MSRPAAVAFWIFLGTASATVLGAGTHSLSPRLHDLIGTATIALLLADHVFLLAAAVLPSAGSAA